jgi:hypothetical protein
MPLLRGRPSTSTPPLDGPQLSPASRVLYDWTLLGHRSYGRKKSRVSVADTASGRHVEYLRPIYRRTDSGSTFQHLGTDSCPWVAFGLSTHTNIHRWMFFGLSSLTKAQRFPNLVKRSMFFARSSHSSGQRWMCLAERSMFFSVSSHTNDQRWMFLGQRWECLVQRRKFSGVASLFFGQSSCVV